MSNPVAERALRSDHEGWMTYCEDKIFFWFMADNRTDATKKALDIASTIIKNEAEGKYPYLRRKVYRAFGSLSPLICPYYDFTTGEIILLKNGRMEIPRSEMQIADDGTILSPKVKEIDETIY